MLKGGELNNKESIEVVGVGEEWGAKSMGL